MAENEIIDLGHKLRWVRTRRALKNSDCPLEDVVAAMTADIEGVCSGLPKALKKGPPLASLLRLTIGSSVQVQAVIAQFNEKSLATLVNDARKLSCSNNAASVAAVAARLLVDRLIDQIDRRAGREERFRSPEARAQLLAEATKTFRSYEDDLRAILQSSLLGEPIVRFKRRIAAPERMTAKQLLSISIARPSPPQEHPHAR